MQTGTDEDDWGCTWMDLQDAVCSKCSKNPRWSKLWAPWRRSRITRITSNHSSRFEKSFPLLEARRQTSRLHCAVCAWWFAWLVYTGLSPSAVCFFHLLFSLVFRLFSDCLPHLVRLVRVFLIASFQGCTNSAKTSDKCLPRLAKPSNYKWIRTQEIGVLFIQTDNVPNFPCSLFQWKSSTAVCFDLMRERIGSHISHVQVSKCLLLLWSSSRCNKGKVALAKTGTTNLENTKPSLRFDAGQPLERKGIPKEPLEAKSNK